MPRGAALGLGLCLYAAPRIMYSSLVYWTGAEPAEHYSLKRRPRYGEYQATTRVLWPFEMWGVDHGRRVGWPDG